MVRAMLRIQGMSEARVQELETRLADGDVEPRLAVVTAFARHMARSAPLVGDEERDALKKAGFGPEECREIAFVVALMTFANRVTTIPAIPPYAVERQPDTWYFALLRPFFARALKALSSTPVRVAPSPHPPFFARLVGRYEGSPIAPRLSGLIDEMWTSPILGQRIKALMFGVIARGLGGPVALGEARSMLAVAGADPDIAERALDHLRAPG